jgi:hypothetical protein
VPRQPRGTPHADSRGLGSRQLDAAPARALLRSCRPDGATLADMLAAGSDAPAPPPPAPAAAPAAAPVPLGPLLLGCSGNCVLRETAVQLWAACRLATRGGAPGHGGESALRLAVRWGQPAEALRV